MAIKTILKSDNPEYLRYRRKADQAWDLASLARQDGDTKDEIKYTEEARKYEKFAEESID